MTSIHSHRRRRSVVAFFTSLILLSGVAFVGCGSAQDPSLNKPVAQARKTMTTAKATASLMTRSIQEVLHQIDPEKYSPSTLTRGIVSFNAVPNGGTLTLDFGDGMTVDGLTVAGQIVSTVTLSTENLTIATTFSGATIKYYGYAIDPETGEETDELIDVMMKVEGTLTAEVSLTWTTATCVVSGPLSVNTYRQNFTLNFNSVTAVLDVTQGTTVFNGPVRLVTDDFGKWRITFKNLLFRAKPVKGAIDIDSGRVIQERLATPIKWKAVYVFKEPNAGDVTIYPLNVTFPFSLEPPPQPPAEEEPAQEPTQ